MIGTSKPVMSVIDEIKEKLRRYPHVRYEVTEHSIVVLPTSESGFEVSLYFNQQDSYEPFNVFFKGWHEAFSTQAEALECFALGLSVECRLKESSRGGEPYKWTVEYRDDGSWQSDSTTTTPLFVAFWRSKTERYLQNNLIL